MVDCHQEITVPWHTCVTIADTQFIYCYIFIIYCYIFSWRNNYCAMTRVGRGNLSRRGNLSK